MTMSNESRNAVITAFTLLALLLGIGQFMFFSRAQGEVLQNEVVNIKRSFDKDLARIDDKLDQILLRTP